jgi:SAM-dependent methyltransferase
MSAICRICESPALVAAGSVDSYRFVECTACGFVFCPQITSASMRELYSNDYHGVDEGAPQTGWADTSFLEPALARLRHLGSLTVLDFGTGQSTVPAWLRSQGHRVTAVDVAPPQQPHPDRLTGDLLALGLASDYFQLSYSYQVFEHLPDPLPYLREFLRVTAPGGLVLIHTDMETVDRPRHLQDWWYVTPPDHCAFYRHRTFEAILKHLPGQLVWVHPKMVLIQAAPARDVDVAVCSGRLSTHGLELRLPARSSAPGMQSPSPASPSGHAAW